MRVQLSEIAPSARLEPAARGMGAPKAMRQRHCFARKRLRRLEKLCHFLGPLVLEQYQQTASPFGKALSFSRTFGPRAISANSFAIFSNLRLSNRYQTRNGKFGSSTRNLWAKPWKSLQKSVSRHWESCSFDPKMERHPTKPHTQSIELELVIPNLCPSSLNSEDSIFYLPPKRPTQVVLRTPLQTDKGCELNSAK